MIRIYNTLSGQKEEFRPISDDAVRMYACGVTVYDHSHIGHARGAVVFDVVVSYLRHRGYKVKYARNFTDVDDKIIKRAAETDMTWQAVAEKYTQEYIKDMDALGVGRPDVEPKATEHIPEIIDLVKRIVGNGYGYESGGDVFFSVRKFKGYGKLSGKSLDDMVAGSRVDVDGRKEDPMDFVLWKSSKPGEPAWDSPWGPGRPGWHIECSAMSFKHLGETFDIHGGGMDLQFPHHENEIAQAEAATGKPFVKYWMHNGFVNVNREKMSKSLGNFFTIKEILAKYEPEAIRLFLLSTHYRNPIDFSDQSLKDARAALGRYYSMVEALTEALGDYKGGAYDADKLTGVARKLHKATAAFRSKFYEAMDDDFNTAGALGAVYELVREVNRVTVDKVLSDGDQVLKDVLSASRDALSEASGILNLFQKTPADWFNRQAAGADASGMPSDDEIKALIEERKQARAGKNWKRADEIRDILDAKGIELLDGAEGTKWRLK
ncbi:MAG: cysteine--tRNA ligase [Nitrospirae bacterium]|nr:cysteine--tRNA ligase [Nitrospirota bacterium]